MNPPPETVRRVLSEARTVAVVGLSEKPERDSNGVARYLQAQGYRVIPVNPLLEEVLGERAYPSVTDIPSSMTVDLIDVFRRSEEVPSIMTEAIARHVPVVWTQLGVRNELAAEQGRRAGILVVEDECIMVRHEQLGIPSRRSTA
jgi:predicted CoA-binding protein